MSNDKVVYLSTSNMQGGTSGSGGSGSGSGSGGGNQMEERLRKVEEAVIKIETTLPYLSTKEDVANLGSKITKAESTMIKWFIGTAVAIFSIGFGVARML